MLGARVQASCGWLVRLAKLNLLWWAVTLAGGFVLGVFPATWAMVTHLRRWETEPELVEQPVAVEFLKTARSEAVRANVLGWLGFAVVSALLLNLFVAAQQPGVFAVALQVLVALVAGMFVVTVVYLPFVSVVTGRQRLSRTVTLSLWFGLAHPVSVVVAVAAVAGTVVAIRHSPGLALFFSPSFACWISVRMGVRAMSTGGGTTESNQFSSANDVTMR